MPGSNPRAGSLAVPKQAAADDGDHLVLGASNVAQTETLVETEGAGLQGSGNIFTVSGNSGGSFYPSAIGGYAYGDEVTNGVYAFSNCRVDSSTTTGHAIVSWRGSGGTGALSIANVVPVNATAAFFNLTITRTVGAGWLVVAPGGTATATASTINWSSAEATIANGSMSTLDDSRQVTVLAGGGGTTDFIVDITGYAL